MFAAAMAFSLGIKLDAIRQGLRTFDTTFFQAPGRMNVFDEHPFKVLFDYGHNAHAVGVMADLAQRLEVHGPAHRRARRPRRPPRRGPRRDRGRRGGALRPLHLPPRRRACATARRDEVPRIIAAGAARRGRARRSAISIIPDEQEAIDAALRMGQPGDLLLVFADALVRSWKQITKFKPVARTATAAGARPDR